MENNTEKAQAQNTNSIEDVDWVTPLIEQGQPFWSRSMMEHFYPRIDQKDWRSYVPHDAEWIGFLRSYDYTPYCPLHGRKYVRLRSSDKEKIWICCAHNPKRNIRTSHWIVRVKKDVYERWKELMEELTPPSQELVDYLNHLNISMRFQYWQEVEALSYDLLCEMSKEHRDQILKERKYGKKY